MDFKKMLKRKTGSVDKLKERLNANSNKKSYDDDRIWKYELDKTGQAQAVLRFLPASNGDAEAYLAANPEVNADEEGIPFWVSMHEHAFKSGGKWYINVCKTTFGDEDCPVCAYNTSEIEKTGLAFGDLPDEHPVKLGVRDRKRKEWHYANVLVVKDPANPQNEGKVMIFKFGYAVHQQILDQLVPPFADDESCDVSDLMAGKDYNLKVYRKNNQITYDKCSWGSESAVAEDAKELEKIWKSEFSLQPFVDKTIDKPTSDLQKQLNRVLGLANAPKVDAPAKDGETPAQEQAPKSEPKVDLDEDDEDEKMFQAMLNQKD